MPFETILSTPPVLELFNELNEGVFSTDKDGYLLAINAWGAQALGFETPHALLSAASGARVFDAHIDWARLRGNDAQFPYRCRFQYQVPGKSIITLDAVIVRSENAPDFRFFGGFREVSLTETEVRNLTERNRELEALRNLAVDATRFADQAGLLASMLQLCMKVVGSQGGAIYLYDQARKRLVLSASHGMSPRLVELAREFQLGQGFTGKVAVTRIPVFIDDLSNHPAHDIAGVSEEGVKNFASFPLEANERLLGVMNLHTTVDEMITGSDFALLGVLSAQVSLSLDHVRRMEELRDRNAELEKFNRLSVDRELRMIELKKRIRELEAERKIGR